MASQATQLFLLILKIKESTTPGLDLPNFLNKIEGLLMGYSTVSRVIHKFKVSGEPKVIAIFEVSNILGLERNMAGLSRMGIFDLVCIPLIRYEMFAADLGVDPSLTQVCKQPLTKKFIYWVIFNVEHQGKTIEELINIWKEDAIAALNARVNGSQLDLFKVVSERKVHMFISVDVPSEVDHMSFDLPMMRENGANVQIECRAVQHLEDYTKRIIHEQL